RTGEGRLLIVAALIAARGPAIERAGGGALAERARAVAAGAILAAVGGALDRLAHAVAAQAGLDDTEVFDRGAPAARERQRAREHERRPADDGSQSAPGARAPSAGHDVPTHSAAIETR